MGFLGCWPFSKVGLFPLYSNLGDIEVAALLNPLKSASIGGIHFHVLTVLGRAGHAKVILAIVKPIVIAMINHASRPFARHIEPR